MYIPTAAKITKLIHKLYIVVVGPSARQLLAADHVFRAIRNNLFVDLHVWCICVNVVCAQKPRHVNDVGWQQKASGYSIC